MNISDQLKIQAMYSRQAVEGSGHAALDLTPEGIDEMSKDNLVELLEAHGATADKRKGRDTLAGELKSIVFMGGVNE